MRESAQKFIASVVMDDGLGDHAAESGHACRQPGGHSATVQGQIRASGGSSHVLSVPEWLGPVRSVLQPPALAYTGQGAAFPTGGAASDVN